MGNTCANYSQLEDDHYSKELSKHLTREHKIYLNTKNILVMGSRNSGKTSFINHIQHIIAELPNNGGFFWELREQTGDSIVYQMQLLIKLMQKYWKDLSQIITKQCLKNKILNMDCINVLLEYLKFDSEVLKAAQTLSTTEFWDIEDENVMEYEKAVKLLWNDTNMKTIFKTNQQNAQIQESIPHFFENHTLVTLKDYNNTTTNFTPTKKDVLLSYHRYKHMYGSVQLTVLEIKNETYHFTKINFRDITSNFGNVRKFIDYFDGISNLKIVFIASLIGYYKYNFDINSQNSKINVMTNSLQIFENICNYKCFRSNEIILLLNKKDLFEQNYIKYNLKEYFKDFNDSNKLLDEKLYFNDCINRIIKEYKSKNKNKNREIKVFVISTLNENDIKNVFHNFETHLYS